MEYFHYIMDNATRKLQEYDFWNRKIENKKKKKKRVTFFFASKRFASEITAIGTFKQTLINVGVDRKVIGTITQLSSKDHRRNYFTMEIKLGKVGIVNLFSAFLRRQSVLKMSINLYDSSKSKNFNDWNQYSLMHRADLVWQDEYQRNINYYAPNRNQIHQQQRPQLTIDNTTHNDDTSNYDSKVDEQDDENDSSDDSDVPSPNENQNEKSNNSVEEIKSSSPANSQSNRSNNTNENNDNDDNNNDGDLAM